MNITQLLETPEAQGFIEALAVQFWYTEDLWDKKVFVFTNVMQNFQSYAEQIGKTQRISALEQEILEREQLISDIKNWLE